MKDTGLREWCDLDEAEDDGGEVRAEQHGTDLVDGQVRDGAIVEPAVKARRR